MSFKEKAFYILLLFLSGFFIGVAVAAEESETIIAINLGTTYSRVGVYTNGKVEIIANDQGNRITPSWVAFTDNELLIGEAAKNQSTLNPKRTIFDFQRLIGKKFDDAEVQREMKKLPYKVVNKDGKPYIQVKIRDGETKVFSPEEISAMVLQEMKELAESYLGTKIKNALITVPAYFNDEQRRATRDAATIAGLEVYRLLDEPFAAAIAYGLHKQGDKNILVFDLGGTTIKVNVLSTDYGVFEVLATSGDTHLGGQDFDHRVIEYFVKLIKKKYNKDISRDKRAIGKLRKECEKAKHALSSQHQVRVKIESLFGRWVDFSEPLTRARFEELNMDLFTKSLGGVKRALEDANLKKFEIHEILLVGGSARIPKVREMLKGYFDGRESSKGVEPDEAIAYGAAILGDIISDARNENMIGLLIDVIPTSLGIETVGGIMTELIPRMSMTPIKKSRVFTTYQDWQTTVSIKVYQGECAVTKGCQEVWRFDLSGIPPAPRGVLQIEVTFEIDVNGTLRATAEDKATKTSKCVSGNGPQPKVNEAEEDKTINERTMATNKVLAYIFNLKDTIMNKLKDATEWYSCGSCIRLID